MISSTPGGDLWIDVSDAYIQNYSYNKLLKTYSLNNVPICSNSIVKRKNCGKTSENYAKIPKIGLFDYFAIQNNSKPNQDKAKNECPGWGIKREVRDSESKPNPKHHWSRNIIELDRCSYMSEFLMNISTFFQFVPQLIKMFPWHLHQLSIITLNGCMCFPDFVMDQCQSTLRYAQHSIQEILCRCNKF